MEQPAFARILVAADGSASSNAAADFALRLAGPAGELIFAHAINRTAVIAECMTPYGGDCTVPLSDLDAGEADLLDGLVRRARAAGIRAHALKLDGIGYDEIAQAAREQRVDAIAIGTHGKTGLARLMFGSTAEGVLRRATVPVIVLRENSATHVPFRCVLAALDESDSAAQVASVAVNLAARDGSHAVFAHVVHAPQYDPGEHALQHAKDLARARGVDFDVAIVHGSSVSDTLRASAGVCHADLIVTGTHGRRGFERWLTGSVAEAIVRESDVPVIVVPVAALRADPLRHRPSVPASVSAGPAANP